MEVYKAKERERLERQRTKRVQVKNPTYHPILLAEKYTTQSYAAKKQVRSDPHTLKGTCKLLQAVPDTW